MWHSLPETRGFVIFDDDMASRLVLLQEDEGDHPRLVVVQPRHLTHPAGRTRFVARWGFDPLADALPLLDPPLTRNDDPRSQLVLDAIAHGIDRQSAMPVCLFLPQVPSVRRLDKPATDSAPPSPAR